MSTRASIEVTGLDELQFFLARALPRLERPAELMREVGETLRGNIERRFDTKRDPEDRPWRRLAESTQQRYDRADTATRGARAGEVSRRGTLLQRTGRMRDSLTVNAGDDWVEVGMSRLAPGGAWQIPLLHETGTARMPRRGIFLADPDAGRLGADDEADVMAAVREFLDDVLGPDA